MTRTEYSWMETDELLKYVFTAASKSSLEAELSERLYIAFDLIQELQGDLQAANAALERFTKAA